MDGRGLLSTLIFLISVVGVNLNAQSFYRLPVQEREALIALYRATDGAHWTNISGWLGAPGTECEWYGVICNFKGFDRTRVATVTSISLSENGLNGKLPAQLAEFGSLEWLDIFGNKLEGSIPEPLVQRFMRGQLNIAAEAPLVTDVSEIDYSWNSPSVLCAWRRVVLEANGEAHSYEIKCRNATPQDRSTFCEIKSGKVSNRDFARLGLLLESSGIFSLAPSYSRSMTHGLDEKLRIMRAGKQFSIDN